MILILIIVVIIICLMILCIFIKKTKLFGSSDPNEDYHIYDAPRSINPMANQLFKRSLLENVIESMSMDDLIAIIKFDKIKEKHKDLRFYSEREILEYIANGNIKLDNDCIWEYSIKNYGLFKQLLMNKLSSNNTYVKLF